MNSSETTNDETRTINSIEELMQYLQHIEKWVVSFPKDFNVDTIKFYHCFYDCVRNISHMILIETKIETDIQDIHKQPSWYVSIKCFSMDNNDNTQVLRFNNIFDTSKMEEKDVINDVIKIARSYVTIVLGDI